MMNIELKRLDINSIIPTKAHSTDAAFDLYSLDEDWLLPGERKLFKTGIALHIPEGYYGRVAGRSGLALKQGLTPLGGVIDSGYHGDIGVILLNISIGSEENSIKISKGQKIAQLIIEKCYDAKFIEVTEFQESFRGEKGYRSSG